MWLLTIDSVMLARDDDALLDVTMNVYRSFQHSDVKDADRVLVHCANAKRTIEKHSVGTTTVILRAVQCAGANSVC